MNIIITDAGRAALINAQNNGTNAVKLTQIAISDSDYTATAADTSLPTEIKRLDTFAGELVAADTIHVTIRDESLDVYSMRAFGLLSDDGTLIAVYSQASAIVEKTAGSVALLAVDIKLDSADAASIEIVGDVGFMLPPGSALVAGLLKLTGEETPLDDTTRATHSLRVTQMLNQRIGDTNPDDVAHWTAAWSWGNHALAGYMVAGTADNQVRSNAQLDGRFVQQTTLGNANGVATLDSNAKIPLSQISDTVLGQVEYQGLWNPTTNEPALPTTPAKKGDYYIVSQAGARFGLNFEVGDWLISNGDKWDKVDNTDAVSSVNGRTGHVTLTAADVGAAASSHSHSWGQLSGIPAYASRWPSWGEVSGKPSTFTPAGHNHSAANITSGTLAGARLPMATNATQGAVKMRISGTTLYIRNDGANA